jgi:chemotaxis protein histidine kinase CheA
MHTDNDRDPNGADTSIEGAEEWQDNTLSWLLEMDMSEPEERLFALEADEYVAEGLSEYEAEVAARPMTRGKAGADDYDTYVEEEIVISSETQSSDIYASESAGLEAGNDRDEPRAPEVMAIDFSRKSADDAAALKAGSLHEGQDILGLAADDDMGEKYLVVKRAKRAAETSGVTETANSAETPAAAETSNSTETCSEEASEPPLNGDMPQPEQLMLSQAPVLRLVSEPGKLAVANEDPQLDDNSGQGEEIASASDQDVTACEASVQLPGDDAEFEAYLLEAEPIEGGDFDFGELMIEHSDGAVPVDSSPEVAIDYHEDFLALPGFDADSMAAITALLPELYEQVSASVAARLQALAMAEAVLKVELLLGGDDESIQQCLESGYEPLVSICVPPPPALQQLQQAQVDVIFGRLVHRDTGQSWSQLFNEDFAAPVGAEQGIVADETGGEPEQSVAPVAEVSNDFAADLDCSELDETLAGAQWEPGAADIDAIFDDFDLDMDDVGTEEAVVGDSSEPEVVASEQLQVFEEDIFAGDLEGELGEQVAAPAEHIDALFESFGEVPQDGGEICGLDVDEFSATDAPILEPEVAENVAAPADLAAIAAEAGDSSWCIPEGIVFSYASQSSAEIFGDFLDAFIEEGSSELEKLEDAIGLWEKDIESESAYVTVTRILHTIKGIAKGVGLQYYGTLIHNFETLLEALPRPDAGEQSGYFRIVNVWLDAAVRGLDHVQGERADIVSEFPQVPGVVVEAKSGGHESETAADSSVQQASGEAVRAPTDPQKKQLSKQEADEGARVLAAQQSVRITSDKLDHMLNLTNQAQQLGVRTAQSTARGKRASAEMQSRLSSVRSHIADIADRALLNVTSRGGQHASELDALEMDQYSELQEAANILREGVEDLADLVDFASRQNAQVEALLKQQVNAISSIGSSIQAARVVPVSRLIPGLRRLVRTVSTELSKAVSLQVLNELGTLDRDDFGRCQTILDHMVRNALDHGIESAEEREAAGKAADGRITVDIRKSGADAIITLRDDGRGINPEAMRDSACKKGLDIDVDALTDEEAIRLIFHKGFSTATQLSQISGRGVGMDIVLSELQQMGGDIQIESTVGEGTAFHIRIPSSVTVNGALLVSAGDQSYAIPLGGLIAVEQVPVDDFYAAVEAGENLSLSMLECEPAYLATLCQGGSLPEKKTWGANVPVIIAGSEDRHLAIAVDDVEEALELVIRSLGVQFSSVPGVAGAATTADGEAIVALDLNVLAASVKTEDHSSVSVGAEREESLLALVVDDSRTQRMVATSQLETVGVETVTAENGGVAIDLLNTADRLPDIILLDVEMPVKDGIQTLREIRKSVRYSHIPVIMITSRTGLKHRALAEAAGCNGYMGKPFNFRMLVGQINELTGHRLQLS